MFVVFGAEAPVGNAEPLGGDELVVHEQVDHDLGHVLSHDGLHVYIHVYIYIYIYMYIGCPRHSATCMRAVRETCCEPCSCFLSCFVCLTRRSLLAPDGFPCVVLWRPEALDCRVLFPPEAWNGSTRDAPSACRDLGYVASREAVYFCAQTETR